MPTIPDFIAAPQAGLTNDPLSGPAAAPEGGQPPLPALLLSPGDPALPASGGDAVVRRLSRGLAAMHDQDTRRRMVRDEAEFNARAGEVLDGLSGLTGPEALPDGEGRGGVLNLARERLVSLAARYADRYQGAYGQAFRDKLGSLAAFRLNAAARLQSRQRDQDFERAWAESSGQYLDAVRKDGGGRDTVFKALHDGLDSLETLFAHRLARDGEGRTLETGDVAARRAAFVAALGETSVLAALDRDPAQARANLAHFAPHLAEGREAILAELIAEGEGTLRADLAQAHLAGLPAERRQELVDGIADPDLRARLADMGRAEERRRTGQEALAAHEAEMAYVRRLSQALDDPAGGDFPGPREIMADCSLDREARERLLALVLDRRDPGEDRSRESARLRLLSSALADPDGMSRTALLARGRKAGVDARSLSRVLDLHREARDNPDLGPALDTLRQEGRGLFRSRAASGRFEEDLVRWAVHFRQAQGRAAGLEEIAARGRALLRARARETWTAGSRR